MTEGIRPIDEGVIGVGGFIGAEVNTEPDIITGHVNGRLPMGEAFEFSVLDRDQKRQPVIMGCYGIGVSRTMAACVEMSHDDNGIVCEGEVTYTHHDGRSVTVPFCNVFEAEAGLISLYRIYIDMGPVFAAT